MKKVIWINGPFGSGKTTLVEELHRRLPKSMIFDPECFGFMIQSMAPPPETGDFQDLPIWRKLVSMNLIEFLDEYKTTMIVSMTLVNLKYVREIFGVLVDADVELDHYFLEIDKEVLANRIKNQFMNEEDVEKDEEIRRWRLEQINRCLVFKTELPKETKVLNSGQLSPKELADQVFEISKL